MHCSLISLSNYGVGSINFAVYSLLFALLVRRKLISFKHNREIKMTLQVNPNFLKTLFHGRFRKGKATKFFSKYLKCTSVFKALCMVVCEFIFFIYWQFSDSESYSPWEVIASEIVELLFFDILILPYLIFNRSVLWIIVLRKRSTARNNYNFKAARKWYFRRMPFCGKSRASCKQGLA